MRLTRAALTAAVKEKALALGFDRVAVGPADPPDHGPAFQEWLDAGYAGEMDYLERRRAERLDPGRLLPGARSVIAVALNYYQGEPAAAHEWASVARYAWGRDYHDLMLPRLRRLGEVIREAAGPDVRTRAAVDTSAVLERDLAARAGLGWVGKNTNLLHPELGSWFFIGIVLTTAELEFDARLPDRCGTCRACLDACPTEAFVAPYVLDARRCISYLTIEHRGPIPVSLRAPMGEWVFGCDLCQTVCPWNREPPVTREAALTPAAEPVSLASLLGMGDADFRARFSGTPLTRPKRRGLLRNAAVALGNRKDPAAVPALTRARSDPEPLVREHAAWALARIAGEEMGSYARKD